MRLALQGKGGYDAISQEEMGAILKRIRVTPNSTINMIDPCAGEGLALLQAAQAFSQEEVEVNTYAVELESSRAQKAKKNLKKHGKVISGGYENIRATNKVFNFLWLNPPFDWQGGQRQEKVFIQDITKPDKYMQEGAVCGFSISAQALADCATILALRFSNLRVYQTRGGKQLIILGIREKQQSEQAKESKEKMDGMAQGEIPIPNLYDDDEAIYVIPEAAGEVVLFRGYSLDPAEIAMDLKNSEGYDSMERRMLPKSSGVNLSHTLLPLKPTHTALVLSVGGGGINDQGGQSANFVHNGDHLIVGSTEKEVTKTKRATENEKGTLEIETERHVTKVLIVTKDELFKLKGGEE